MGADAIATTRGVESIHAAVDDIGHLVDRGNLWEECGYLKECGISVREVMTISRTSGTVKDTEIGDEKYKAHG